MNRTRIAFWIFTGLFCFQIGFTAYAQLMLPQVGAACTDAAESLNLAESAVKIHRLNRLQQIIDRVHLECLQCVLVMGGCEDDMRLGT